MQQKDSLGAGKCLVNMGIISTQMGDYFGGQEISLSAIPYFHETDTNHLYYIKSNLNNLGISFYNLKEYDLAIKFYRQSLTYAADSTAFVIKNNIGNAYREKKDLTKSLEFYDDILKEGINNKTEYSRALTNSAITKWLQNPNYNAAPELLKALHIREKGSKLEDLSSSYLHLSNFYLQNHLDSALFYARKMYGTSQRTSNAEDKLLALHNLIKLSPSKESKNYFLVFEKLNDSVQTARASDKNQFALIRYETEKQKSDNLLLQKDNTEKKYQLIILITSTIILLIFGVIWYKKRKQRLELEAQNTIRENQLRTSKKVHDVVANGLYRVMTEIENREDIDKEHILDKIDDMYQKSRDISYDQPQTPNLHFNDKLTKLLQTFETATIKVVVLGNTAQLWEKVTTEVRYEVEHILQELLVNMDKHSQATEVTLQFEQIDNHINIYYTDNGIGLSKDIVFKNGLTNTGNRIAHIHGSLTFDTETEKGLNIKLSFPIS
ncbi:ATP-binding protein [Pedobacter sp. UC225_65]|uniref:tetratricopeptide repeat-containing sensor histidine kinase n=1 Tax=Pedobacter sp. UC225_65 TaxID=3350173 RepID=UPI003672867C